MKNNVIYIIFGILCNMPLCAEIKYNGAGLVSHYPAAGSKYDIKEYNALFKECCKIIKEVIVDESVKVKHTEFMVRIKLFQPEIISNAHAILIDDLDKLSKRELAWNKFFKYALDLTNVRHQTPDNYFTRIH